MKREYAVGERKPPQHSRFKKGQSGNPSGRRKNLATLVKQAIFQRVTVTENGRRKTITKLDAILKRLVNKAASGDHRAINLVLPLADNCLASSQTDTDAEKSQAEIEAEQAGLIDRKKEECDGAAGASRRIANRARP
jgi:hypothetical protein